MNARVAPDGGELRARVLDGEGKAYPGFDWQDCEAIRGDRVDHAVQWKADLGTLAGKHTAFEFSLKRGRLYAFDLRQ